MSHCQVKCSRYSFQGRTKSEGITLRINLYEIDFYAMERLAVAIRDEFELEFSGSSEPEL